MSAIDCQVCEETVSKYRCSHCQTRSCSLSCFKSHQTQCQGTRTQQDPPSKQTASEPHSSGSPIITSDQAPRKLNIEHVQVLFREHPSLKAKLSVIYQSTLHQASNSSHSVSRGALATAASPEEKAFSRGLNLLNEELSGDHTDDLAAFAAYIRSLADSP